MVRLSPLRWRELGFDSRCVVFYFAVSSFHHRKRENLSKQSSSLSLFLFDMSRCGAGVPTLSTRPKWMSWTGER